MFAPRTPDMMIYRVRSAKQSTANIPLHFKGVALSKHYHIIWASRQLVNK